MLKDLIWAYKVGGDDYTKAKGFKVILLMVRPKELCKFILFNVKNPKTTDIFP